MIDVRFVYELITPGRLSAERALDALVDPILEHLPEGHKAAMPSPDALNVRFWTEPDYDVYMSHGIADKGRRGLAWIGQFPHILVPGPYWTRRLTEEGIERERIHEVGYSKLDPVFQGRIRPKRSRPIWAPTHARDWPGGHRLMQELTEELGIPASLHPNESPHNSTLKALAQADVVIADAGSTIYEAWSLGKPVVLPDFAVTWQQLTGELERMIYREQIGYHVHRPRDLAAVVKKARKRGITDRERALIDDLFPPAYRGVSGQMHAEALRCISAGYVRRAAA